MTTDIVPDAVAEDSHGGHGEYHQDTAFQPRANRIGLWMFIFSECFLFAAFLAARFYSTGTYRPEGLNQALALTLTMVLLVSSISAYLAEVSIKYNHRRNFKLFTIVTILLGFVFLAGVAVELTEAIQHYPPETPYGTSYFMLIGLHAFHVFSGIVALFIVLFLGFRGHFGSSDYWGAEGVVKYWHFVDLAWVIIYPTLYLF
ncbi:MAG: cytochrome c oxidase subunit 3 [Acidimicrobiia bacterium]|nr:cytochrome c oxidase subunit 3 [Acidimicrobiia bacterium]